MKIYNEDLTKEIQEQDIDYSKYKLVDAKRFVRHHEAVAEVKEQFHYETIREYPNGGKDVKKVIDVEYVEPKEAYDEYEDVLKIEPLNETELLNLELGDLYAWFDEYDNQVKQYTRCQRMGIAYDKDIVELDNQAKVNAERITEIRNLLKQ